MAKTKKNGKQAKKAGATSPKSTGTARQRALKAAADKKIKDEKKRAGVKTANASKKGAASKKRNADDTTSSSEPNTKQQKTAAATTDDSSQPKAKKQKTAKKTGATGGRTGGAAAKAPTRRTSSRTKKTPPIKSAAGKRNSVANVAKTVAAAAAKAGSRSAKFQVINATDPSKGANSFYKKITANATIVIVRWIKKSKDNKKCIFEGFRKVSDGIVKRKELIALLRKEVYSKLPKNDPKFETLRSSDFLSKKNGLNLCNLLARCNLRADCIQGTNMGKPSSYYINSNEFKIKAQQTLNDGDGVANLLDLTSNTCSGLIGLYENDLVPFQQFKSIDAAISCVADALVLSGMVPDAHLPATLSAEEYQEHCKSINPNNAACELLDAIGRRDARSLRCQSAACLQVAIYCLSVRAYQGRVLAVKSKDGKQIDFGSMVSIILLVAIVCCQSDCFYK